MSSDPQRPRLPLREWNRASGPESPARTRTNRPDNLPLDPTRGASVVHRLLEPAVRWRALGRELLVPTSPAHAVAPAPPERALAPALPGARLDSGPSRARGSSRLASASRGLGPAG